MDENIIQNKEIALPVYIKADSGKRFLNFIIDAAVVIFLLGISNKLFIVAPFFHLSGFYHIALIFVYFYGLESSIGQTVGKMITKTKVVAEDGGVPTSQNLLIRSIARFIPLEPLLYINGQWLHDSLSKTKVVMEQSTKI